jgi:hypothetical protein
MPVLAIFTPEIATGTGDTEPEMTWEEMIERRLFNGANIHHRGFPINDAIEFTFLIFPISAEASLPITDGTFSRTKEALNLLPIQIFIEHRLVERGGWRQFSFRFSLH